MILITDQTAFGDSVWKPPLLKMLPTPLLYAVSLVGGNGFYHPISAGKIRKSENRQTFRTPVNTLKILLVLSSCLSQRCQHVMEINVIYFDKEQVKLENMCGRLMRNRARNGERDFDK